LKKFRDKIYRELLIAKNPPDIQAKIEQSDAANMTPYGGFGRQNAMEYFDKTGIMPGSDRKYPFLAEALGILLACRRTHAEANQVLFRENTFEINVEWERVHSFWRCDNPKCCAGKALPCFVMYHNIQQIKHLYIIVKNAQPLDTLELALQSARLFANLQTVAYVFKTGGNKLKTLKIRYISCFGGHVEAMRDAVEGPILAGTPERLLMLKDDAGQVYHLSRAEIKEKLMSH
jgi:hypothetical protein